MAVVDIDSRWEAAHGILHTRLGGPVGTGDATRWRDGLHAAAAEIPDGGRFRLLLDLRGFDPVDLAAHRAMREVVPRLLASHGLRPAFVDLFDDRPEIPVATARGVRCIAFANVHHDAAKMASYGERIGRPEQRFFTDLAEARTWLQGIA